MKSTLKILKDNIFTIVVIVVFIIGMFALSYLKKTYWDNNDEAIYGDRLDGIENWDVSRVSDFSGMFQGHSNSGDSKFKELNVSSWNTSHALSMSHMFYGCAQLTSIPIDNWDVSKVGNFSHMFADCYVLQEVETSNWKTNSATNFAFFYNLLSQIVDFCATED